MKARDFFTRPASGAPLAPRPMSVPDPSQRRFPLRQERAPAIGQPMPVRPPQPPYETPEKREAALRAWLATNSFPPPAGLLNAIFAAAEWRTHRRRG
jgi:hypothetical protein